MKWGKLCLNLNNGINGLYGKGLREEMGEEGFRDLLVLSIHEALEVLGKVRRARGRKEGRERECFFFSSS